MPEWLTRTASMELDVSPGTIVVRLLLATLAGILVAVVGHAAHGHRKADGAMLSATLVLLTILIAMVTLVIGNSVARAFGLVGALSIVRFRTVVDDTRDTAFVIFAVIVGMAIGAGAWLVPAVGIPLVGAVAIVLDRLRWPGQTAVPTHSLVIRLGLGRDVSELDPVLDQYLPQRQLRSTCTARQGAALDLTYFIAVPGPAANTLLPLVVGRLNRIEGVQMVEIAPRERM